MLSLSSMDIKLFNQTVIEIFNNFNIYTYFAGN